MFHTRCETTHSILFQFKDVTFLFIIIKNKVIDINSIHLQRLYLGPPKTDGKKNHLPCIYIKNTTLKQMLV